MSTPGASGAADDKPGLIEQRIAQVQAFRAQMPDMPREAVRGYPVPFVFEGQPFLAFPFFRRFGRPPAAPTLSAPGWIVSIDLATGQRLSARTLKADLETPLGEHKIEPPLDSAGFERAEAQMFAAMLDLLPILRNPAAGVPAALLDRGVVFSRLWRQLSHKPLAAHYRALNPGWFEALAL